MAKKSAIIGEYIVTINDSGAIEVARIYKSTMAALREIAAANNFEVKDTWFAHALGRNLLKEFCGGASEGVIGEYAIEREANNRINVIRTYKNSMAGLREASAVAGFTEDPKEHGWNTQAYGRHLLDFVESSEEKTK